MSTLLIAGGVAANSRLRELAEQRCAEAGLTLRIPRPRLCTDNGAMIASFAAHLIAAGAAPSPLDAASDPGLPVVKGQVWHEPTSVADKLDIIELLYRYAELIDAGDFDGVGELLSRASFGGTGPQGVSGAENIAEAVRGHHPPLPRPREHTADASPRAQSHRRAHR